MNRPVGLLALVVAALALGCPKKIPPASNAAKISWKMSASGDGFRLSDADEGAAPEAVPLAKTKTLSATDTDKVLARLPPMKGEPSDEQSFALRDKSVTPPRAGKSVQGVFPAPANPPPPSTAAGALRVVRKSPVGDIDVAPFLSVTFSQPLVGLTSQAELAKIAPPAKLSPQPPGEWRWLGT